MGNAVARIAAAILAAFLWAATGERGSAQALPDRVTVRVADGFDFPVGKPDGAGHYKSRGFRIGGHAGEDWNAGPGDSDIGVPVYNIAHGVVVLARDIRMSWGKLVIVRHAYPEGGQIAVVDSVYAHLHQITVREGQRIAKGTQVGTIGNNRGMYDAHLHFEIRKNLAIGSNASRFARDFSNYWDPSGFIQARRRFSSPVTGYAVAMNTFTAPAPGVPATATAPRATPAGLQPKTLERRTPFRVDRYEGLGF